MKTISSLANPYRNHTDDQLIRLVKSGHQQACAALHGRYEHMLQSVLRRYLSDPEAVKEITQDAFLRAFRKLDSFRGESKFSTWLCRIGVSLAISRRRTRRYAGWTALDEALPVTKADVFDSSRALEQQETGRLLRQALRQLSEQDAIALDLYYFREQSIEEIGHHTGWTQTNIKTRLSRARHRLQQVLVSGGLHPECWS